MHSNGTLCSEASSCAVYVVSAVYWMNMKSVWHDLLTRLNLSTISSRQTRLSTMFRLSATALESTAAETDAEDEEDVDDDGETGSGCGGDVTDDRFPLCWNFASPPVVLESFIICISYTNNTTNRRYQTRAESGASPRWFSLSIYHSVKSLLPPVELLWVYANINKAIIDNRLCLWFYGAIKSAATTEQCFRKYKIFNLFTYLFWSYHHSEIQILFNASAIICADFMGIKYKFYLN